MTRNRVTPLSTPELNDDIESDNRVQDSEAGSSSSSNNNNNNNNRKKRWNSMDEMHRPAAKRPQRWWPTIEDDAALVAEREARLWTAGNYRLDKDQLEGRFARVVDYRLTPYNNMWIDGKQSDGGDKKPKDSSGLYVARPYAPRNDHNASGVHEYLHARTFDRYPPYELSYTNYYGFAHSVDRRPASRRSPSPRRRRQPSPAASRSPPPSDAAEDQTERKKNDASSSFRVGMISPAEVVVVGGGSGTQRHAVRKLTNGMFVYDAPYVYDKVHEYKAAREYNRVHVYPPQKDKTASVAPHQPERIDKTPKQQQQQSLATTKTPPSNNTYATQPDKTPAKLEPASSPLIASTKPPTNPPAEVAKPIPEKPSQPVRNDTRTPPVIIPLPVATKPVTQDKPETNPQSPPDPPTASKPIPVEKPPTVDTRPVLPPSPVPRDLSAVVTPPVANAINPPPRRKSPELTPVVIVAPIAAEPIKPVDKTPPATSSVPPRQPTTPAPQPQPSPRSPSPTPPPLTLQQRRQSQWDDDPLPNEQTPTSRRPSAVPAVVIAPSISGEQPSFADRPIAAQPNPPKPGKNAALQSIVRSMKLFRH